MCHWSVTFAVPPLYLQRRCPSWTVSENSVSRDWTGKKGEKELVGDNVSAFSYMERQTNNSWFVSKMDMEKTSKIKDKALSWNQRQENQNAYYTKILRWISSKLTPADASCTCESFRTWIHSCADPQLCAIAVTLPPQPISSWLQNSHEIKILNHVSKFSVASETNVVSKMIADTDYIDGCFE